MRPPGRSSRARAPHSARETFIWGISVVPVSTSLPANRRRRFACVGKFSTISHESSALKPALSILQLAIRQSAHERLFGTYVRFWRATCLSLIEELFMVRQGNGALRVPQVRTHERRGHCENLGPQSACLGSTRRAPHAKPRPAGRYRRGSARSRVERERLECASRFSNLRRSRRADPPDLQPFACNCRTLRSD